MINKANIHNYINTTLLLTLAVIGFFYSASKKEELAYIDNIRLFNGFNMTRDIKAIEEVKINEKVKELDSLYVTFQSSKDKENLVLKNLQQQIALKSKSLQEFQDNYSHNLSNSVWERLNEYIKEYAEDNHLKIVFGTSGNGNIMYAHDSKDITNQILEYSNKKYEGNY